MRQREKERERDRDREKEGEKERFLGLRGVAPERLGCEVLGFEGLEMFGVTGVGPRIYGPDLRFTLGIEKFVPCRAWA